MKRSEAVNAIKNIMKHDLKLSKGLLGLSDVSDSDADKILLELEELGIIDSSQFGSICSRCDRKSWDSE